MMRKFRLLPCFFLAFLMLGLPTVSHAQVAVGVSVRIGPPPLRVYAQPICPGPGYMWTPGYWAYGPDGYYWVPGAWVLAPRPGFLWTPGYWGFAGGVYAWHAGYWGPHVGFYGGINYGFGYGGVGFVGGEWRHDAFFYNRSVTNINVNIHNTYNRTVIVRNVNHVSFNGEGGVRAVPNRDEMRAEHEEHFEATHEQIEHRDRSASDRAMRDDRRDDRAADRRDDRRDERAADHRDERRDDRAASRRDDRRDDHRDQHENARANQHNDHNQRNHGEKQKPERNPHGHNR